MKCPKCNNKVPDKATVCFYCGKKLVIEKPPEKLPENDLDFEGVNLIHPHTDQEAQENALEVVANHEDVRIDSQVRQPANKAGQGDDLELLYHEDQNSSPISKMITSDDVGPIRSDEGSANGLYSLKKESVGGPESEWEETGIRNRDGDEGHVRKEIVREIIHVKHTSNAVVGYVVIILSVYLMLKTGLFFLNHLEFMNKELFAQLIWPWTNLVGEGILIFAMWIIAIVTKPWSLKFLAILFTLCATGVYGYYVYYFSGYSPLF